VTVALDSLLYQYSSSSDTTTTSLTDVVVFGMTSDLPGYQLPAGDYIVSFTGTMSNTNTDKQGPVSLYVNGVQVPHTIREAMGNGGVKRAIAFQALLLGLTSGTVVDVRWRVTANTGSFGPRCLLIQRLGT
jgi:hypothetical protein